MRANHGRTFEEFYGDLENEAQGEGPEAIRDLRAKEVKYALINTLITRRRDLNLTQQTLAKESGVAQTEISRIERGRKSPTLDTFSRLAGALRLELWPTNKTPRYASGARAMGQRPFLAIRVREKAGFLLLADNQATQRKPRVKPAQTSRPATVKSVGGRANANKQASAPGVRRPKRKAK